MSFYLLFNATLPGARRYSWGVSRLRGPQDSVLCLQSTGQPHASCATRRGWSSQASPHPEGLLPQPTEGGQPLGHCNFLPHQDTLGTWVGERGLAPPCHWQNASGTFHPSPATTRCPQMPWNVHTQTQLSPCLHSLGRGGWQ